jgi:hypothetical protein
VTRIDPVNVAAWAGLVLVVVAFWGGLGVLIAWALP